VASRKLLGIGVPGSVEENGEYVIGWAPRDVSLKMRIYQVLSLLWCVVATQFAGSTIGSNSRRVLIDSKSGTEGYFNSMMYKLLDVHLFPCLLSQANIY
jgi:hypothetical protein